MDKNATYFVIGIMVIIIGIIAVGFGYNEYKSSKEKVEISKNTTGKIINNDIERKLDSKDDDNLNHYQVSIEYEYSVNNKQYTNNYISPSSTKIVFDDRISAEDYINNNSVGDTITLYYIPDKPQTSFIKKSLSGSFNIIATGLMFILAGMIVAVARDNLEDINKGI
jgi:hypothetical protein